MYISALFENLDFNLDIGIIYTIQHYNYLESNTNNWLRSMFVPQKY